MAKFTKPFRGVPAGEVYPVEFKVGDECPPELVAGARSLKALAEGKKGGGQDPSDRDDLVAKLEAAGIEFDKRWGVDKLAEVLAAGKKD